MWEEVGLEVELVGPAEWTKTDFASNKDLVPPVFVNRYRINDIHDHSSFVFAGKSKSRKIYPQTKEDLEAECVWVTKEELESLKSNDKRLGEDTYRYALMALELVK